MFCRQTPFTPLQIAKTFLRDFKDVNNISQEDAGLWIEAYVDTRIYTIRRPMAPAADHHLLQAILNMCGYLLRSVYDPTRQGVIPLLVMTYFK